MEVDESLTTSRKLSLVDDAERKTPWRGTFLYVPNSGVVIGPSALLDWQATTAQKIRNSGATNQRPRVHTVKSQSSVTAKTLKVISWSKISSQFTGCPGGSSVCLFLARSSSRFGYSTISRFIVSIMICFQSLYRSLPRSLRPSSCLSKPGSSQFLMAIPVLQ